MPPKPSGLFTLAGLRPHEAQLIEVDYGDLMENVGKTIDAVGVASGLHVNRGLVSPVYSEATLAGVSVASVRNSVLEILCALLDVIDERRMYGQTSASESDPT